MDLRPGDFVPTGIALMKRFVVPMPRCVNPGGLVQTGGHEVLAVIILPVQVLD